MVKARLVHTSTLKPAYHLQPCDLTPAVLSGEKKKEVFTPLGPTSPPSATLPRHPHPLASCRIPKAVKVLEVADLHYAPEDILPAYLTNSARDLPSKWSSRHYINPTHGATRLLEIINNGKAEVLIAEGLTALGGQEEGLRQITASFRGTFLFTCTDPLLCIRVSSDVLRKLLHGEHLPDSAEVLGAQVVLQSMKGHVDSRVNQSREWHGQNSQFGGIMRKLDLAQLGGMSLFTGLPVPSEEPAPKQIHSLASTPMLTVMAHKTRNADYCCAKRLLNLAAFPLSLCTFLNKQRRHLLYGDRRMAIV